MDSCRPINLAFPIARHHPLNQGRIAWWLTVPGLDGGRFIYSLLNSYHARLNNMTTSASGWRGTTRKGGFGHLLLDGVNDYLTMFSADFNFTTGDYTLAASMNISTSSTAETIWISRGSYNVDGWYANLLGATGVISLVHNAPAVTTATTTSSAFTLGVWQRILISRRGSTAAIFINGVNKTSGTPSIGNPATSSRNLNIGSYVPTNAASLNGPMDDITIYNRALSNAEAFADYEQGQLGYPDVLNRMPPMRFAASSSGLLLKRRRFAAAAA